MKNKPTSTDIAEMEAFKTDGLECNCTPDPHIVGLFYKSRDCKIHTPVAEEKKR